MNKLYNAVISEQDPKVRASLKSSALSSITLGGYERASKDVTNIDILSITNKNVGIEIELRAYVGATQIGFGKDGTIDIERFRIWNPPILIDDPIGDIVLHYDVEVIPREVVSIDRRLREDATEALLIVLERAIRISKGPFGKIITNKVGRTTDTFYPDPNTGSTTVDGRTYGQDASSWAGAINDTGTAAYPSSASTVVVQGEDVSGTYYISRSFFLFDTSAISDTDTIDSATLDIYYGGSNNQTESTYPADLCLVSSSPASDNNLVSTDYQTSHFGSTEFASRVTLANFVTSGSASFSLNASGLAAISKTGNTKLGVRPANDIDANAPSARSYGSCYFVEHAGTANDPTLTVVHSAGGGGTTVIRLAGDGGLAGIGGLAGRSGGLAG